jgi:class 3 adenylate cyclase
MITRLLSAAGPYAFDDRGEHELKGLPAPVELFAVTPA